MGEGSVTAHETPFVTVIMPVRNEEKYIGAALDSVLKQHYPPEKLEILVVDGMSDDQTRRIAAARQKPGLNLAVLDNPGRIVPKAMNIALRQAHGEVIIRVDGHCEVQADYIQRCVEYLSKDSLAGVGGRVETIGQTPGAEAIALAMSSWFGVGGSAFRTQTQSSIYADSIPFPAYPRQTVARAGLYDEELVRNQDDEYNYRIRELGGRLLLASDIVTRYYSRGTLRSLLKQYFQYGYWKVRVLQKHPRQMSLRQFVPALFVFALVGSLAAALIFPRLWWLLVGVLGSYLAAGITTAAWLSWHRKKNYILTLTAAFAALHLGYGSGFLVGLVKFARRWQDKTGLTPGV